MSDVISQLVEGDAKAKGGVTRLAGVSFLHLNVEGGVKPS